MHTLDQRLIVAGRAFVIASLAQVVVYGLFGLDGYEWQVRPFVFLWMALPIPLAWWIGCKLARTNSALAVLVGGLLIAFALVAWMYWEITWGRARTTESLSGLLFLFGPLYQYGVLALAVLSAALIRR